MAQEVESGPFEVETQETEDQEEVGGSDEEAPVQKMANSGDTAEPSAPSTTKNQTKSEKASTKSETTGNSPKAKRGRRRAKERSSTRSSSNRRRSESMPKAKRQRKSQASESKGLESNREKESGDVSRGDKSKATDRSRAKGSKHHSRNSSASTRSRSRRGTTKPQTRKTTTNAGKKIGMKGKRVANAAADKGKRINGQGTSQPPASVNLQLSLSIEIKGQIPAGENDANVTVKEFKHHLNLKCDARDIDSKASAHIINVGNVDDVCNVDDGHNLLPADDTEVNDNEVNEIRDDMKNRHTDSGN